MGKVKDAYPASNILYVVSMLHTGATKVFILTHSRLDRTRDLTTVIILDVEMNGYVARDQLLDAL